MKQFQWRGVAYQWRFSFRKEFKFIGVFHLREAQSADEGIIIYDVKNIYICPLPCCCIHLTIAQKTKDYLDMDSHFETP